jgi:hypothetical protein
MGRFLAQELSEMQMGAAPGTAEGYTAVGGVKIPGEATKLEGGPLFTRAKLANYVLNVWVCLGFDFTGFINH